MTGPIQRFLAATDLDDLAADFVALPGAGLDADGERAVLDVVAAWTDLQALANLLMYPTVVPEPSRLVAIERALADTEHSYLRLAAVVGIERIEPAEVPDDIRHRLVQTLLDLIGSDEGVTADRASIAVMNLARTTDAPELVAELLHPSERVRRNLTQALIHLTGVAGVAALLDEPGFVATDVRERVREQLVLDDVDLTRPAEDQRRPRIASYLPTYAEWQGGDHGAADARGL